MFNPHAFGAHSETWGDCFLEIVSRPPDALAGGMPDRLAYLSSVPSAVIHREMSLDETEYRFKYRKNYPHRETQPRVGGG